MDDDRSLAHLSAVGRDQLLVVVYACPPRFVVAP